MTLSDAVAGVPQMSAGPRTIVPGTVRGDAEIIPFPFVGEVAVAPGRAVGAHREPGSTPWRTGLREIVSMLTFGLWTPWAYRPTP